MTAADATTPWKAKFSPEPGLSHIEAAWWQLLDGLHAQTPIMVTRPLVRDEKVAPFRDNRWPLTLALHQAHAQALCIDWLTIDPRLRDELKTYVWVLLNYELTDHDILDGYARLSVRTIYRAVVCLRPFASFLLDQGRHSICETTNDDLERYADFVAAADNSDEIRRDALSEVRRLWAHRLILPEMLRLPDEPPWAGLSPMDVLGIQARPMAENATLRIAEHTMHGLLTWALRFAEFFADDILAAAAQYNRFAPYRRRQWRNSGRKTEPGSLVARAEALVEQYRFEGRPLPGRATENGVELDFFHLGRLLDARPWGIRASRVPDLLLSSGLPIIDCAPVTGPVTASLDGVPWKDRPISYDEVGSLVNALTGACLIIVAYLSGMRPAEVLNLRRGCVHYDKSTGLWTINGLTFKTELNETGHKPEGAEREVPWVVVKPVAQAAGVMERLHASPLLFPTHLLDSKRPSREGAAIGLQRAGDLVSRFIAWVNAYCADHNRPDFITPDPVQERITLSRFRRTLCWHIYRRPRGVVAAAIQYGHLATRVTLGYAGNAESGFPDELAFERFLARLEDLGEAKRRLDAGEHVSGPSAQIYRERVTSGSQQFQGVVLTSGRQAKGLLTNPSLQIYHGRGMTCVPQMGKQLCQLRRTPAVEEDSPDLPECRRGCQCKAHTDADIIELQQRVAVLQEVVDDPLTPPLRLDRERDELQRLIVIISEHHRTSTTA